MIVTTVLGSVRTVDADGESMSWRCLVRRGMLHSECESFDHVRLVPGAEFALRGREGIEQVWFTLRGTGEVSRASGDTPGHPLGAGDLVLAPHSGERVVLRAGSAGLDLLWLTVLPSAVTATLPPRKPVIP